MKLFASLLIAVGCLLALPGAAMAATYIVDSTGDEADETPGAAGCTSPFEGCTLRAAIEESNFSTSTDDLITFASNPFDGKTGDTITLATSLPLITDKVHIDADSAGQCTTSAAGLLGPCAEVSGSGLVVEADGVEIDGLAVTGATAPGAAAIRAFNGAQSLVLRDNWLGVKLDGAAGANGKGVFLDPDSNEATIGGTAAADRNVIANNEFEGLDIEGASNADVLGNYFGVKPDGATSAANSKNIEITDTVAFEAIGNEVGTTVVAGAAPCDGGCNVISGAAFAGIDLHGNGVGQNEEPATGPTTIHGNYIGLNAAGTATVANTSYGVNVNEATDALIGGTENEDANFIAGGAEGIFASSAEGFEAVGNIIGSGAAGAEITAPGKGVFLLNISNVNRVAVSDSVFDMDGGIGIEARFGGTDITGNFIEGAEFGVYTTVGPNAAGGTLVEDNVIGESLANGVLLEGNASEVLGNTVYKSGAAGIRIRNSILFPTVNSTENLIGGDAPADENNINESGGDAIEIDNAGGEGASQNEVARNRGAKNSGFFIDLIGSLTNGGILPPTFGTAVQASASGTAEPGALVRVFRKGAAEAGELESFLGEAEADGGGNWAVAYPAAIPAARSLPPRRQTKKAAPRSWRRRRRPIPTTAAGVVGPGAATAAVRAAPQATTPPRTKPRPRPRSPRPPRKAPRRARSSSSSLPASRARPSSASSTRSPSSPASHRRSTRT